MSVFRRMTILSLAFAACTVLTACDSEPSESDMKGAVGQTFGSVNKELASMAKLVGKDLSTKIKSFKKLACVKPEGKPGYACDFEMTVDGPLGDSSQKASARFVKSDKGWTVME